MSGPDRDPGELSSGIGPLAGPTSMFWESSAVDRALALSLERFGRIGVRGRWFINSHPKSGTHLLRNILLHFNTPEIFKDILFYDTFGEALQRPIINQIYMGHLPYSVYANCKKGQMRSVLLVRHPGAVALALTRAFYDQNSSRPDHVYMREHDSFEAIVRKVVCGYECLGQEFRALANSLTEFCLDWLNVVEYRLKYEDIIATLRSEDSEDNDLVQHFRPMLGEILEAMPADMARRIRAGAASAISATFSRAVPSDYDEFQPEDVYRVLRPDEAHVLRSITARLGY